MIESCICLGLLSWFRKRFRDHLYGHTHNVKYVEIWSGDSSVVRAPDSCSKGHGFESLLERWENFLLQGQPVLTLILVSVPTPCYRSRT